MISIAIRLMTAEERIAVANMAKPLPRILRGFKSFMVAIVGFLGLLSKSGGGAAWGQVFIGMSSFLSVMSVILILGGMICLGLLAHDLETRIQDRETRNSLLTAGLEKNAVETIEINNIVSVSKIILDAQAPSPGFVLTTHDGNCCFVGHDQRLQGAGCEFAGTSIRLVRLKCANTLLSIVASGPPITYTFASRSSNEFSFDTYTMTFTRGRIEGRKFTHQLA